MFDRGVNASVIGYNDGLSAFGSLKNNLVSNGMDRCDIISI